MALDRHFRTSLGREAMPQTLCSHTADHMEDAMAFMKKRQPKFQGK